MTQSSNNRATARPLPAGAAASGKGTSCKKWAVKLVQKTKDGKYSPKGELKGMAKIPYEIYVNDKLQKGVLGGTGKSKDFTSTVPANGAAIDIRFGLNILPDYASIDKDFFDMSSDRIDVILGEKIAQHKNKCAVRISMALNSAKDCKYIIERVHRIPGPNALRTILKTDESRSSSGVYIDSDGNPILDKNKSTIKVWYLFSSEDVGDYLKYKYPDSPTLKKATREADGSFEYSTSYQEYNDRPKGFYQVKATFSDAVGHVDVLENTGMDKLDDYAKKRENVSEFYM